MVLGNDHTQLFYWPFQSSSYLSLENEHVWVKECHRTDLPVTKSHRLVRLQRQFETIKSSTLKIFFITMAKYPQFTPLILPRLCARVNMNADQVLYAPNAIHFWGGMEHGRSYSLEMGVKADENFENVVKSWRYVIEQVNIIEQLIRKHADY